MPELPEVETVRRQLAPLMRARRLAEVTIVDERLTRPDPPEAVAAMLAGTEVVDVGRRGKYLVFELDAELSWLVHLRMTGSFATSEPSRDSDAAIGPAGSTAELDQAGHRRATIVLDDGLCVEYHDVRRFGTWTVLERDELDAYFDMRLGPEPLDSAFDQAWLSRRLESSRAPIKAALLDQRTVAGVGNIYADEALWRAGVHPGRAGSSLRAPEIERLVEAVRAALAKGIERQGATLRDYRAPNGARGTMQDEFAVYGREGEPCERCAAPIAKTRLAGRGTWFCSGCQPAPRRRRTRA